MFWSFRNSSYLCIRKREISILVKYQEVFLRERMARSSIG